MTSVEQINQRALAYAEQEATEAGETQQYINYGASDASSYLTYTVEYPSGIATVTVDPNGKLIRRRWRWS